MNYIEHLNRYRVARLKNPISSNAISLYFILLEYNNMLGWIRKFTVPNTVLQGLSGLTRNALHLARNELKQKGYIKYDKGSGNQCGSYLMVRFDTQSDTQSDTQTQHSLGTLTKLNETKLNNSMSEQSSDVKFADDSNEIKLCNLLAGLMRRNNPNCKIPDKFNAWAKDFDLLMRLDKRDYEDVVSIIKFSQWDDFWLGNIHSPAALRRNFDKLTLKKEKITNED